MPNGARAVLSRSTLRSFSCIDSFDSVFDEMTSLKSTSHLTFSAAKSCKSHFSGHLAPLNLVKALLADTADKYCIA